MNIDNNKQNLNQDETLKDFEELVSNIRSLKDKQFGCPWQKSQTNESLIPFLIEESYEFIDAINKKNINNMKEELGDILFQIMLHSEISREKNEFEIKDVIKSLNEKIKLRHPYTFDKREKVSLKKALEIKEKVKSLKKSKINSEKISDALSKQIEKLPSNIGTLKISNILKKYGLNWKNSNDIIYKLDEEIQELKTAIKNKDYLNITEEIGDLFFTLINLSIFYTINSENALRSANSKFLKRLKYIENVLDDKIYEKNINKFKELWPLAKKHLKDSDHI